MHCSSARCRVVSVTPWVGEVKSRWDPIRKAVRSQTGGSWCNYTLQDSGAQSQIRPRHRSRPAGRTVHTNILFHIFHVNCIVRLWEVLCIISTKFEGDFLHGELMLEEVLGEAFFMIITSFSCFLLRWRTMKYYMSWCYENVTIYNLSVPGASSPPQEWKSSVLPAQVTSLGESKHPHSGVGVAFCGQLVFFACGGSKQRAKFPTVREPHKFDWELGFLSNQ